MATPLGPAERAMIEHHVPLVRRLPDDMRTRLDGKIQVFLEQVDFVGCDGLEITEEMRLSVAAQACLLVVNSEAWYDPLTTILIYPGAFKSRQQSHDGYVVSEAEIIRSGESWTDGPVVLSWAHSQAGAANDRDGQNVVFHEFAHQLDALSGHTDGAPLMAEGQDYGDWARTMQNAYARHQKAVSQGRATAIDAYGATLPEEYFAVVVEMFFETPEALKREEPEVYDQLVQLMQVDPVGWG